MSRGLLIVVLSFAVSLAGCGGGSKPKTLTLEEQMQKALQDTDPAGRARKLARIAGEMKKRGDASNETATLEKAAAAAKDIEDPVMRAGAMNIIADAFAQAGRRTDADALISDIRGSLKKIDSAADKLPIVIRTAETLGQFLNEADTAQKDLAAAEHLAGSLEDPLAKLASLLQIAQAHHRIGGKTDADRILNATLSDVKATADARKKSDLLAEAAGVLFALDKKAEAAGLLAEAKQLAPTIEDTFSRAHALKNLAAKFLQTENKDEAKGLLSQAEKVAEKVGDPNLRTPLVDEINKAKSKL